VNCGVSEKSRKKYRCRKEERKIILEKILKYDLLLVLIILFDNFD